MSEYEFLRILMEISKLILAFLDYIKDIHSKKK